MATSTSLEFDPLGIKVDVTRYRGMIGSLLYLTTSHPDIMFAIGACARFQVSPTWMHIHTGNFFKKYLKGTISLGLWYPKQSNLELVSFCDEDYASRKFDRKSTSGACYFLGLQIQQK